MEHGLPTPINVNTPSELDKSNTSVPLPTPLAEARDDTMSSAASPMTAGNRGSNQNLHSSPSMRTISGVATSVAGLSFASAKLNKQNWVIHNQTLDSKHERDLALAETISTFLRKKTELELDYCKGLDKLLKQTNATWNSTKFSNNNTRNAREGALAQTLNHLLTEGESTVKNRLDRCEDYLNNCQGPLWQELKKDKSWMAKKALEMHNTVTEEMFRNVVEYEKSVKSYVESEKESQACAKKLSEYEKNPKTGVLSGLLAKGGSVAANAAKLEKYKKKALAASFKANEARNDHLIQLEAFNAMNTKYSIETIPTLLSVRPNLFNLYA